MFARVARDSFLRFVRGALTLPVCAVLGLPLSVASTVPSITHVISLTTYEVKQLPEGERKVPSKVVEQRATNFLIHVLIGCALFLAPALKFLPRAVLQGVFFYMGIASLTGNNLFDRLFLWLIWDPAKYPQYHYIQKLPIRRVHLYTLVQAGWLWKIDWACNHCSERPQPTAVARKLGLG